MPTEKRFINCLDCGKRFDQFKLGVFGPELCAVCLEAAEWENTHSDYGHDEAGHEDPACPVCMDEGLVPDTREAKKAGHGKGGGKPTAPEEVRTKAEIIDAMRKAGYDGPVSYVKRDLLTKEAEFFASEEA